MFCPNCRRSVQEGAVFCPFCGMAFENWDSKVVEPTPVVSDNQITCPQCGNTNHSFITKNKLKVCVCNKCGKEFLTKEDTAALAKAFPRVALLCAIGVLIMAPCIFWSIDIFVDFQYNFFTGEYYFEWSDWIVPGILVAGVGMLISFCVQYIFKSRRPWDYPLDEIMNKEEISKSSKCITASMIILAIAVCIMLYQASIIGERMVL